MSGLSMALAVAAGGAVGALGRHSVNALVMRSIGPGFPWATLLANVSGSLAMGLLVGLMARGLSLSEPARAFLTIGMLGAFTTFSTYALDVVTLTQRGAVSAALGYAAASVLLCVAAVWAGLALVRLLPWG